MSNPARGAATFIVRQKRRATPKSTKDPPTSGQRGVTMIDLSYLTEEEQDMIMEVLKRDAELKKAEEERIKRLKKAERDKGKLKYMTGEWFYETKSWRHRDRIHGSDIIRASMRQRKPVTLLELTQIWAEKPSFVNSANKDIFVPAELSGLIEEPPVQPKEERENCSPPPDVQQEGVTLAVKRRENPFNSALTGSRAEKETEQQLTNGAAEQITASEGELLPSSESNVGSLANIYSEGAGTLEAGLTETTPLPKKRTLIYCPLDNDEPFPKWSITPRGILKHNSSCSSFEFPIFHSDCSGCPESPDVQRPPQLKRDAEPTQRSESVHSLDRKQVRFSPAVRMSEMAGGPTLQDDREFSERDLLDMECQTFSDEEGRACKLGTGSLMGENSNDHRRATCEVQWEEENPSLTTTGTECSPSKVTEPPTSQSQHCKLVNDWEGMVTGEHECRAESPTLQVSISQCSVDQKGKPVHVKARGCGLSSRPAEESHRLTEEQGGPISKVLEWFSQSSYGNNRQEEHSHLQYVQKEESVISEDAALGSESAEATHFGSPRPVEMESPKLGKQPYEEKVEGGEGSDTEALTLNADVPHIGPTTLMKHPVLFSPYTEAAPETKSHVAAAAESKLKPGTVGNKDDSLSHPVMEEALPGMKQKEIYDKELPQKLAVSKSFWEKGNRGPIISKSSKTSKTNEKMKEFGDLSEVAGKECSTSDIGRCKSRHELPFMCEETAPAPETIKAVHGKNILHFKGSKGCEPLALEAGIKRNPIDSAESSEGIVNKEIQSSPSLFHQEVYLNPGMNPAPAPSRVEESVYFESKNLSENQNKEDIIYVAKPIVISEEVSTLPMGLKCDSQTGYQREEVCPRQESLTASSQTGSQQDDRTGKILNLKSFWEKEKSDPKIMVGKRKGSSETKVNQNPEATSDKTLVTSGSETRTSGTESDNGSDSQSSLLSMKERVEKQSESQTLNNTQYKTIHDIWGTVPSIKTQLPSTEDVPQYPERPNSRDSGSTDAFQQVSQSPAVETSPDCPPEIPPRRPVKTETCSSKSHSAEVCPPIRELMKKDQKQAPPVRQTKKQSHEGTPWESTVTKPTFKTTGALSVGRPAQGERSHLWRGYEKSPVGEPVASQSHATPKDKESKPQPPRRTGLGDLNGRQTSPGCGATECASNLIEGNLGSPEAYGRMPEAGQPGHRRASEGHPSGASEEADSHQALSSSIIPQGFQYYMGIPEGRNDRRPLDRERREEGSSAHPPTASKTELDVVLQPVQASTPRGPREVPQHPQSQRGSEGHVTDDADFDSSRSSTSKPCDHSWGSSACCDEAQSPVRTALKRISARPMSFSKSLEDITSPPTIPSVPAPPSSTFSDSQQMKRLSMSVPAFLQEEIDCRESDSTSETSFRTDRQRKGSASTSFSTSSGMASMSSVSGSVMSIYSGDFGNVEVKGTIQFATNYVQKLGEFHIFVVQCRDLAVADTRKNRSDPYVKCYLLPDKAKLGKRKTTVKKKTFNPTYNEILRYRVDMETLKSQKMNISVWHNDTFGRNSFLGEVDVDLSKWDFRNTHMNDFTLKPKSPSGLQPTDHRGEIWLALRFLHQSSHSKRTPRTGEVQILVKECKNLPFIRGAIDPFVKCSVLPDTSRKSRQKSRVLKRTANPVFNHTMVYDGFLVEDLQEACVELTVWDHDRLNNHFLGGVRLSLGTGKSYGAVVDWMDSNSNEATLWERMIDSHNEWVEDTGRSTTTLTGVKQLV
ncbi:hypothetical protein AAFF_G00417000 [Aldrovandia affinis]|uniref:Synaptotagmin-like protein 2 n=1 Tax=Aldrovandia affinis TaxID=143900 RepID=A0AAD7SAZ6_9TELE|nr:hypothetical protein AAFF_G00417000 [Aldrovandia affinis]